MDCLHDSSDNRVIEERFVLDFIYLKQLLLGIRMRRLPDEQQLPSNLTYILLAQCRLEEDPMPILEKLRHLEVVHLGTQSFSGRRMICSDSGFPRLQQLYIERVSGFEEWIVEEGSMPLLNTLWIRECEKLKELPDGLRFINSLQELKMDSEWEERLTEGGEDYYKVQHIPSVKYRLNTD